jgi:hypothetical protein
MANGGEKSFGYRKKVCAFFALCFSTLLLSGCEFKPTDGLRALDARIGEVFKGFQEDQKDSAINFFEKGKTKASDPENGLTDDQKRKIDEWLDKNGYNRYGDSQNAVYDGGTPLVDEKTGETMERYAYILKKFPDILERAEKEIK